jgi:hypothetical protein
MDDAPIGEHRDRAEVGVDAIRRRPGPAALRAAPLRVEAVSPTLDARRRIVTGQRDVPVTEFQTAGRAPPAVQSDSRASRAA